jgi:hypothetical protein
LGRGNFCRDFAGPPPLFCRPGAVAGCDWAWPKGANVWRRVTSPTTRIPKGADLILNKCRGPAGSWRACPRSCRRCSMRWRPSSRSASDREGDIGMQLGEIAKANPASRSALSVLRSAARVQYQRCDTRPRCSEAHHGENRGSSPLGSAPKYININIILRSTGFLGRRG